MTYKDIKQMFNGMNMPFSGLMQKLLYKLDIDNNEVNKQINNINKTLDNKVNKEDIDIDSIVEQATPVVIEQTTPKVVEEIVPTLDDRYVQFDKKYPKLTAGFAENLISDDSPTEEEVTFRPTAGEERNVVNTTYYNGERNGVARIEKIKGNSIVHNQLLVNDAKVGAANENAVGFWYVRQGAGNYSLSNNGITIYFNSGVSSFPSISQYVGVKQSHKYLINMDVELNGQVDSFGISINIGFGLTINDPNAQSLGTFLFPYRNLTKFSLQFIVEANVDAPYFIISARNPTNDVGEYLTINNAMIVDLTREFTAGNEPTTIEEFYAKLPIGVNTNAYNPGTIIDGNYNSIKTTGFNQWDEQWELGGFNYGNEVPTGYNIRSKNYIRVLAGVPYKLNNHNLIFMCYDENYNFIEYTGQTGSMVYNGGLDIYGNNISKSVFIFPQGTVYTRFFISSGYGQTYKNDICINIVWSEYAFMNGMYAPYKPFVRDLSWIKNYFPNGMRSAGSVHDEIRFNSITQKWEAVTRVGVVNLGSMEWQITNDGSFNTKISNPIVNLKAPSNNNIINSICSNYIVVALSEYENTSTCLCVFTSGRLWIKDDKYTDINSFQKAIQGVMFNYELTEPSVKEIEEDINMDFDVYDYGTEELVTPDNTPSAPLKADIIYSLDAFYTLKNVPDILKDIKLLKAEVENLKNTNNSNIEE